MLFLVLCDGYFALVFRFLFIFNGEGLIGEQEYLVFKEINH